MSKVVKQYWNKIRKPVLIVIVMIGIGFSSYGAGTFFPNYWTENKLISNAKASFYIEWKEFDKIMTKDNISRKECLLLPINTTLEALNKKKL